MGSPKFKLSDSLSRLPPKSSFRYSTWYSPPPPSPPHTDDLLAAVSTAINNAQTKPLASSLRRLLPSLRAHHVVNLLNHNPFSLHPLSLFSFFNWLSSQPTFRHTVQSYCAMAHFLCAHRMFAESHSIVRFLVSRKGKDSASSIFAAILEVAGPVRDLIISCDSKEKKGADQSPCIVKVAQIFWSKSTQLIGFHSQEGLRANRNWIHLNSRRTCCYGIRRSSAHDRLL